MSITTAATAATPITEAGVFANALLLTSNGIAASAAGCGGYLTKEATDRSVPSVTLNPLDPLAQYPNAAIHVDGFKAIAKGVACSSFVTASMKSSCRVVKTVCVA